MNKILLLILLATTATASNYFGGTGAGIPTYANFAALPACGPSNDGAAAITVDTDTIYVCNGGTTTWTPVGGSGVALSVGTIDGVTASSDGASLSANKIYMQSASSSKPGLVNNTTQTFSGAKTFTGTIGASNLSGTNTGDVSIAAFGSTPNANGFSLSSQVLNMQPADATHPGGLSISDWNTFNNKQATGLSLLIANNLSDVNSKSTSFNNLSPMTTLGDIIIGGASGTGTRLAPGSAGQVLTMNGTQPTWSPVPSGGVTSVNASVPAASILGVTGGPITGSGTLAFTTTGTSGGIPYFSSTSALSSSGLLTNHAIILGGGAGAAPYSLGSLGTSTTVLHGAAAGDPTFGAVSLTADISGVLAVANGGFGAASHVVGSIPYASATTTITDLPIGTASYVLTSNGTLPTWSPAPTSTGGSSAPVVIQSRATPVAVSTGTIASPTPGVDNLIFVGGNGGPITVTAPAPMLTTAMTVGQKTTICGTDDTKPVTYPTGVTFITDGIKTVGKDNCFSVVFLGSDGVNNSWVENKPFSTYGKVNFASTTSCGWHNTTSTSAFTNFGVDSDCAAGTGTGIASAPATKLPAMRLASGINPGRYLVRASGTFVAYNTALCMFRFSDGTVSSESSTYGNNVAATIVEGSVIMGEMVYTSNPGDVTIQLQAKAQSGTPDCAISNDGATNPGELTITISKVPN